jgi:hypothetical protein
MIGVAEGMNNRSTGRSGDWVTDDSPAFAPSRDAVMTISSTNGLTLAGLRGAWW